MILRRIASALKRQDWTTVFIEFVLVVAGVLFALQVDNWAHEKAERAEERAALERLFSEAQNAYELTSFRYERAKRLNGIRRNALAFVDSETPIPENTLPIKIGINTMAQHPQLIVVSVVFDELQSTGKTQLVQSAPIRDAISAFHADIKSLNLLQDAFGDSTEPFWEGYRRNITWRYNPDSTTTDIILSSYNWQALRQDKDFILTTIAELRNQLVAEDALQEITESAKSMCDLLGNAVGRTCLDKEDQ